ncbi:hypothetical protein H9X96_13600 [Pedobacter sp. N36a]|uniref:DUF6134 family protein n=1 Tax=Pedobacter sp. N36a TaxID=2767996 RepID=UPI0016571C48|nr:DUF6134 family protein [Pedobacter sp. N36a]MBC8986810.1 hypothetical protein [Pedobacter sp. N36a]
MKKKIFATILLSYTFFSYSLNAQQLNYEVLRNNKKIGNMQVARTQHEQNLQINLQFKAKMSLPLKDIVIEGIEKAIFFGGKLTQSTAYRKVNGQTKTDIETKWVDNKYRITNAGKSSSADLKPIRLHLLSIYFIEPKNDTLVYSDSFQRLLLIQKDQGMSYKLALPNGNVNLYTYKNGICTKVVIQSTFYTITMQKL